MKNIVEKCAKSLQNGEVILYPTDTIWGLGCDATDSDAIDKIYKIKERPFDKKCIVLMDSVEMLYEFTSVEMEASFFTQFDTPTTLIIEVQNDRLSYCLSDENTLAFRIPNDKFCMNLLSNFGKPIISTSANISTEPNPKHFHEISDRIKDNVNFIVPEEFDKGTKSASQIFRLLKNNELEKLR